MEYDTTTKDFIEYICDLYGDVYDDRIEDSRPPAAGAKDLEVGSDWRPGQLASHKSLAVFERELRDLGIKMSGSKIKKILITGGCWTTKRSREIADLYEKYTNTSSTEAEALSADAAIKQIAEDLGVSTVTVSVNLPYKDVVYNLDERSNNARRCAEYRKRKRRYEIFVESKKLNPKE